VERGGDHRGPRRDDLGGDADTDADTDADGDGDTDSDSGGGSALAAVRALFSDIFSGGSGGGSSDGGSSGDSSDSGSSGSVTDCESAWNPAESTTDLSKQLRDWQPDLAPWNEIGFTPDGQVRCNYEMYSCEDTGSTGGGQMLLARGWCDLDQDGLPYQYAQANDSAQAAFGFASPYERSRRAGGRRTRRRWSRSRGSTDRCRRRSTRSRGWAR